MGWIFKNKRNRGAPVPIRKLGGQVTPSPSVVEKKADNSAEFPVSPEALRKATGVNLSFPNSDDFSNEPERRSSSALPLVNDKTGGTFITIDSYRSVLRELDDIKATNSKMTEMSKKLLSSEFSEKRSFTKLKTSVQEIHDDLLSIDKTVFGS
jgi:hypothetical protein